MSTQDVFYLCLALGIIAFLYSSVGHAGASGYIAVMSLADLEPKVIKPTALVLNVLVASITFWQFSRSGFFSWKLFWPFACLAVPMAFVGGYLNLPTPIFKVAIGVVLIVSAFRFVVFPADDSTTDPPKLSLALSTGAGLGLLAGLTGTGGGIFLTPLLLIKRWATAKTAAAVSSLFILLNSVSGLLGYLCSSSEFPTIALPMGTVVVIAGILGSYFGSRKFAHTTIKRLLALVLWIAGTKLIFSLA